MCVSVRYASTKMDVYCANEHEELPSKKKKTQAPPKEEEGNQGAETRGTVRGGLKSGESWTKCRPLRGTNGPRLLSERRGRGVPAEEDCSVRRTGGDSRDDRKGVLVQERVEAVVAVVAVEETEVGGRDDSHHDCPRCCEGKMELSYFADQLAGNDDVW